jgi:integrase
VKEALDFLEKNTSSSSHHYSYRMLHLEKHLGTVDVNDLGLQHITGYIRARLAEAGTKIPGEKAHHKPRVVRVSKHTIAKELTTLGTALRMAHKRRWPDGERYFRGDVADLMPDDFSAEYRPRERWLSVEEFTSLLAQLAERWQVWTAVAVYTGARAGEVNALSWADLDLEAATLHLPGSKTEGADRVQPLHEALAEVLAGWKAALEAEALEEWHQKGRAGDPPPLAGPVVGTWHNDARDMEEACERAKIAKCTPNDLRRTFASWLAEGNVNTLAIAKLLGHTTTRMAEQVYARLGRAGLARAVEALPNHKARTRNRNLGTATLEPQAKEAVGAAGAQSAKRKPV